MPRLQDAELVERLRRRLGLRGVAVIDTVAPEIVPILDVDRLEPKGSLVDVAFAAGLASQAASPGNYGRGLLLNPTGSGLAVDVVSVLTSFPSGAGAVRLVRHGSALGTAHGTRFYHGGLDATISTGAAVTSEVAATASLTQVIDYGSLLAASPHYWNVAGLTIYPGEGVGVQVVTANLAFDTCFRWRERALEDWERELVS